MNHPHTVPHDWSKILFLVQFTVQCSLSLNVHLQFIQQSIYLFILLLFGFNAFFLSTNQKGTQTFHSLFKFYFDECAIWNMLQCVLHIQYIQEFIALRFWLSPPLLLSFIKQTEDRKKIHCTFRRAVNWQDPNGDNNKKLDTKLNDFFFFIIASTHHSSTRGRSECAYDAIFAFILNYLFSFSSFVCSVHFQCKY